MMLVLAMAASASVAAQPVDGWRPFFAVGLTKGGDVIDGATVIDDDGNPLRSQRLYAGNLIQLGAGAMWTARSWPLSIAFSANYHIDDITGRTENAKFVRYPLEAIAYYVTPDRAWRAGLGVRYVYRPRITGHYPNEAPPLDYEYKFDNATGFVAETGWAFGDNVWFNFRAVRELYKRKSLVENGVFTDLSAFTEKENGSHVGANFVYAF
jgi:hypothetical protein